MAPRKNPVPGTKPFWTEDKLIEGIVRGMGIPAEICRWLTTRYGRTASKSMFFYKLKRSPRMQEKMHECKAQLFEVVLVGIVNRAMAGFPSDQRFLAGKLGPQLGWFITKHLKNGSDGSDESLIPQVVADGELTDEQIALLTDAELRTLRTAREAEENARRRQTALSGAPDMAGR